MFKPIDSGCTEASTLSKTQGKQASFPKKKAKKQQHLPTLPNSHFAPQLTPSLQSLLEGLFLPRSPSFSTIKENQTLNESKSPKVNTLTLNIISSTDFSKDKMPKVWKSFRNRAFPFLAIPSYSNGRGKLGLPDRFALIALFCLSEAEEPTHKRREHQTPKILSISCSANQCLIRIFIKRCPHPS